MSLYISHNIDDCLRGRSSSVYKYLLKCLSNYVQTCMYVRYYSGQNLKGLGFVNNYIFLNKYVASNSMKQLINMKPSCICSLYSVEGHQHKIMQKRETLHQNDEFAICHYLFLSVFMVLQPRKNKPKWDLASHHRNLQIR